MTVLIDPTKIARELTFLQRYPHFEERPASVKEFLGPDYLDCEESIRPGVLEALVEIFGEDVNGDRLCKFERAMMTGGIGIGKTTFASIALPYMAHYVLCMKNPQKYYRLLPGSRIAFMQMSTSEGNASEVVFGDIFARIKHSKWFATKYPHDPTYKKQIRFPKDIWILPGDSQETTFEGYNILGGILDEMDSHKITDNKDYADEGFNTIHSRISSRFVDLNGPVDEEMGHLGLLICIGQMKKSNGFAARKYAEFMQDPKAYVKRMTIWESFGWDKFTRPDGTRASFWYDAKRKKIIPSGVVGLIKNDSLIEIPLAYKKNFDNNPEKALRDLAGIPPTVASPFISMIDKIEICRDKWHARFNQPSPVGTDPTRVIFGDWFVGYGQYGSDPRKRTVHIDFGLSKDAMGIAMAHIDHLVEREGENKPYIIFDFLARLKARPGEQIIYSDMRSMLYHLKDDLRFRLVSVTMDGFQSTDTQQQLRKKRLTVDELSMDKTRAPYEDLREAIYEERVEFPKYLTKIEVGDMEDAEIALSELTQLQDMGKKIDHPPKGSKDVADAMAGCVYTLMGDRTYRRGVASANEPPKMEQEDQELQDAGFVLPGPQIQMPVPSFAAPVPTIPSGLSGLMIPPRLRPDIQGW